MSEDVELSTLNLRYEGYRLRDDATEARVRAGGMAGALPLDANGRAAERRHGDS